MRFEEREMTDWLWVVLGIIVGVALTMAVIGIHAICIERYPLDSPREYEKRGTPGDREE